MTIDHIRFEWDEAKSRSNQSKHGVSFHEAQFVFFDEHARFVMDPDHSVSEDRFLMIGRSARFRVLVVSHVYRRTGRLIRIVSARKATATERAQYEALKP